VGTISITEDQVSICGKLKGGILPDRANPIGGPENLPIVNANHGVKEIANGYRKEELVARELRGDTIEPSDNVKLKVGVSLGLYYAQDVAAVVAVVKEIVTVDPNCRIFGRGIIVQGL
jgi:hypothetical protein